MARVLRLADAAQGDTINLLSGTWMLDSESWASFGGGSAEEVMALVASSTSAKTLTNAAQEFDEMLKKASEYHEDLVEGTSYWLEMNADGEDPRRSLLYGGNYTVQVGPGHGPFFQQYAGRMILRLDHHPLWESTASTTVTGAAQGIGAPWVLSAVAGTEPARLQKVKILNSSVDGWMTTFWMGIRPAYEGTTDFLAKWELEDGTLGTDATVDSTTDPNGASPGSAAGKFVKVTFATTTMARRISLKIDDIIVGTHYDHFHGEYQVLLRYQLSAAGTCGIEMRTGYGTSNLTNYRACNPQFVSGTGGWYLHEMGTVTIPAEGGWYGQDADYAKYFTIELAAERVSGTPNLYLDCLILVPTKHFAKLENCYVAGNTATDWAEIWGHEDDSKSATSYSSSKPIIDISKSDLERWELPRQGGVLVCVGTRQNQLSAYTDTVTVALTYFSRWKSYRETS